MATTPQGPAGDPDVTPDGDHGSDEESMESQEQTEPAAQRANAAVHVERPQDQADDVATSESEDIGDDVRDTFKPDHSSPGHVATEACDHDSWTANRFKTVNQSCILDEVVALRVCSRDAGRE